MIPLPWLRPFRDLPKNCKLFLSLEKEVLEKIANSLVWQKNFFMLWALLYSASSLTHPPQHDYITLLHYIILLHYLQFPKEFYTLLQPPAFRHIFHSAWTPFLSFLLLANSYLYFRSQFRYFFLFIYLFIYFFRYFFLQEAWSSFEKHLCLQTMFQEPASSLTLHTREHPSWRIPFPNPWDPLVLCLRLC